MAQLSHPVSNQQVRSNAQNATVSREVELRTVDFPRDAERILGVEPVRNGLQVRVHAWDDTDWVRRYNTLRAPGTPYRSITFNRSFRTVDLEHYGLEAKRAEEDVWADGFNPELTVTAVEYQELVAIAMAQDQELELIDILILPATYAGPGNSTDLAGGTEWNAAGGDLKGNIEAAKLAIRNGTSLGEGVLTLWLPYDALRAARADTDFITARSNTARADIHPTVEDLENYLNIAIRTDGDTSVEFVDAANPTRTRAWGDNALVFADHEKVPSRRGRIGGRRNFGRVFKLEQFAARRTFFEPINENFHYRRKMTQRSVILNPENAFLFYNVST